ncbi:MAG: NAD(P)/FAD-dependent oxidoreductase [Alphaproteobacteria bacterium]
MRDSQNYEVVVIGAGPVGLFAAFQCGLLGLKCHIFDALSQIGGQCTALYPEKPIINIPAHKRILAKDLIKKLKIQLAPFKPIYHLCEEVMDIDKLSNNGQSLLIKTNKESLVKTSSIVIAGGGGSFKPNRLPLKEAMEFEEKSLFYHISSAKQLYGKRVVIIGGGNSAVDWALSLYDKADVTIIHRRDNFRALDETTKQLRELCECGKIKLLTPFQIKGISGENGNIKAIDIIQIGNQKEQRIKADILLPFLGLKMDIGPISKWGLDVDQKRISIDPTTSKTNHPGIYAVGDIATYPNKLKLILAGFNEAMNAAFSIQQFLHPDKIKQFFPFYG